MMRRTLSGLVASFSFVSVLMVALVAVVAGTARAATACENEQVREEQLHGTGLPDCRAYQQVSPLETGDVDAVGQADEVQAAPDGSRVRFWTQIPFPDACGSKFGEEYVSSRGAGGVWSTEDVLGCGCPETNAQGFSEDLTDSVVFCEGAALTEGASPEGRGFYLHEAGGGLRLIAAMPSEGENGIPEQQDFNLDAFSADDSRLIFESSQRLVPAAQLGLPNLYGVDLQTPEPTLSVVGLIPPSGHQSCGTGTGVECELPGEGAVAGDGVFPWNQIPKELWGVHDTQS